MELQKLLTLDKKLEGHLGTAEFQHWIVLLMAVDINDRDQSRLEFNFYIQTKKF